MLTCDSAKFVARLLANKFKLKALILSNNGIQDEGARALMAAIQVNPYLTKFKLDLNPVRNSLVKEIENLIAINLNKIGGQEITHYKSQVDD